LPRAISAGIETTGGNGANLILLRKFLPSDVGVAILVILSEAKDLIADCKRSACANGIKSGKEDSKLKLISLQALLCTNQARRIFPHHKKVAVSAIIYFKYKSSGLN
jgi:hypothetical protein